ncbi:hypothetical protein QQ045_011683 [Rhodiola kirilowii]
MASLMRNIYKYGLDTVVPDALITPRRTSSLPSLATIHEESHERIGAWKGLIIVLPLFISVIFLLLAPKPISV